jgi:hypothetical protein
MYVNYIHEEINNTLKTKNVYCLQFRSECVLASHLLPMRVDWNIQNYNFADKNLSFHDS